LLYKAHWDNLANMTLRILVKVLIKLI